MYLNPFPSNVPILYSLKQQKSKGFLVFSGVKNGNIGQKWVKKCFKCFVKMYLLGYAEKNKTTIHSIMMTFTEKRVDSRLIFFFSFREFSLGSSTLVTGQAGSRSDYFLSIRISFACTEFYLQFIFK